MPGASGLTITADGQAADGPHWPRKRQFANKPAARAAAPAAMRAKWTDPAFRAAHAKGIQRRNADPAFQVANAERMRKRQAEPGFGQKAKAGRKGCPMVLALTRAPDKAAIRAFAREHGVPHDIADDALFLMAEERLDALGAIAAARAYAAAP